MRRIMCVRLPSWPIDRMRRRRPALRDKPLVLTDSGQRQLVVAACGLSRSGGVRPGMTAAEAAALCRGVTVAPHAPVQDAQGLEALGRWMMARVSPLVALSPPDALLIEIGGSERLLGGVATIARRTAASMRSLRLASVIAVAPTAGTAWALAAAGRSAARALPLGTTIEEADVLSTLQFLPVHALRIDPAVSAALRHVGVETIGQLLALPRSALPARFGQSLLDRLDHATGRLFEPLNWLTPRSAVSERLAFEGAIDSLEAVWHVLGELVHRVAAELARRGSGAMQLVVRFDQERPPPRVQTLTLSRPSRDVKTLLELLKLATENLRTGGGFVAIELAVPRLQKIVPQQASLAADESGDADAELAGLIERVQARLGDGAVVRPRMIESHLPERTFEWARGPATSVASLSGLPPPVLPTAARPMSLLPVPVEIGVLVTPSHDREGRPVSFTHAGHVHRLRLAVGPERIAGTWWSGHEKTRDYYDVEDPGGRRFWVFRVVETGRWFLHGHFE